ncbi:hypothetical protein [Haloarchaeobius sp. TZWSO28]|uniref:hypothetical protein n=1 Tax=Haloarchaeobius sp. TZWSO28 TaxID=3446119 RepID=UPI003EB9FAF6
MFSRRSYLTAVGSALATATAGCSGNSNPGGDADATGTAPGTATQGGETGTTEIDAPDAQPFDQALQAGDVTVSLSNPVVQDSYFTRLAADAGGVMAVEGTRFVFVTVESTGTTAPSLEDLGMESAETAGSAWTDYEGVTPARPPTGAEPYDPERGTGWVGFTVPAPLQTYHRIALSVGEETARTQLPESVRGQLSAPVPTYEVSEFSAPESASPGDAITVSATVSNTSDAAGTFRGALNGAETTFVDRELQAGSTTEWQTEVTATATDEDANELDLSFQAVGVQEGATVSLDER